jgi:hypothetical protein
MGSTERAQVQRAVLAGDLSKSGPHVFRDKWAEPDKISSPHFHSNDWYVTVLNGTYWVGSGNIRDPDNAVALSAGSYVTLFGKQVHWAGTKKGRRRGTSVRLRASHEHVRAGA